MIPSWSASVNGALADADACYFCSRLILNVCEAKYDVTPDLTGSSDFKKCKRAGWNSGFLASVHQHAEITINSNIFPQHGSF